MNIKHRIAAGLALALGSGLAQAAPAVQTITVTEMSFYNAGGLFAPNQGGFNDTVVGSVNSNGNGSFNSGAIDFFYNPWVADQQMWDSTPGAGKVWAGTTAVGPYSFTYSLAENQVAVGLYFDWSVNQDIAVFQIFDCPNTGAGACVGIHNDSSDDLYIDPAFHAEDHPDVPGSVMVNGPFPGQHATFIGTTDAYIDATPVANGDTVSATTNTVNSLAVLTNDVDFEDIVSTLTVSLPSATSTQGFALAVNPDGTISYTAGAYLGADDFTYTVTDSFGNTSVAGTVNVTVIAAPNAAPVELSPSVNTDEDTDIVINTSSLATDADDNAIFVANYDAVTVQGGTVAVNGNNNHFIYTPPLNYNGADDTFTYQMTDTIDSSGVGTVTISINPINDAPVCNNVDLVTDSNTALDIDEAIDLIEAACSDVDDDQLTIAGTTQPTNVDSMLESDGAGTLTYTPATDYAGDDSFDFTVSDGQGGSVTATVNISVGVLYGNFTMLTEGGNSFGGTNDVIFTWDEVSLNVDENDTDFTIMTIESKGPYPFLGVPWYAHHVRVFGPGTYTFETDNSKCSVADLESTGCPGTGGASEMTLVVGDGQLGAHILFDYSGNENIDVINLWDQNAVWNDPDGTASTVNDLYVGPAGTPPDPATTWKLVSRDADGVDGFNGAPMIDGPFIGFSANFSYGPSGSAEALPPITGTVSDTKLGNGALGLASLFGILPVIVFFRRRSRNQQQ